MQGVGVEATLHTRKQPTPPPSPLPPSFSDGLERVTVPDTATLADLKAALHATLGVDASAVALSKDAALLTAAGAEGGVDLLAPDGRTLAELGVGHGDLVRRGKGREREREGGGITQKGRSTPLHPPPSAPNRSTCTSPTPAPFRPPCPPPPAPRTGRSAPR